MNRYADPAVCPGCLSTIEIGTPSCPSCDLRLTGPTAQQLFVTLLRADQLVDELRSPAVVLGAPTVGDVPGTASAHAVAVPSASTSPRRASGLSAASIPKILLGLGAVCLLVAALVFLAVAWSTMSMGGRTAVLVGLTATASVLCVWVSRRGLRAGAESFASVALGLLALDVSGADSAGWLGDLTASDFAILLGAVVGLAATIGALAALRSPVGRLVAAELVAAFGLATVTAGWATAGYTGHLVSELAATVLTAIAALASWRARLVFAAWAAAAWAGLWWLTLTADGIQTGLREATVSSLWGQLQIWPVLAAALLAAVPALVRRLPEPGRIVSAAVATTVLATAVGMAAVDDPLTTGASVALAVLAVAVAGAVLGPGRWGWSTTGALTLSAVFTLQVLGLLLSQATDRLLRDDAWSVGAGARVGGSALEASPLLVVPAILLLVAAAWAALDLLGSPPDPRTWVGPAGILLLLGVAGTLASYDVFRWVVVAVLLGGTAVAWALSSRLAIARAGTVALGAPALVAALPSDWLTASALLVLTALAFAIDYRSEPPVRGVAAAATIPLLGGLLWSGGHLALLSFDWRAVVVIAVLGLVALARPTPAYELAAAPTAVVAVVVAEPDLTWLAVHLTLAGALVSASALYNRRAELGWLGSGLLFAATWVRLADLDVTTVEAYTLPLALALVGFGLLRLRRDDVGTVTALGAGLALALVPSLLLALVDPVSTRAALLGIGCAAVVVAGAWRRWSAPLVIGGAAGLLLVVREASYASVLPQWVIIALVGTLLTVVGVTWERRLQELRLAAGYIRGLR